MQTLKDFQPLRPAEEKLVAACRTGDEARIAGARPDEATDDNTVGGPLIRFLALGGDAKTLTHDKGVRLFGAWIEDALDFDAADITRPLWLIDCHIAETPVLRNATARTLGFPGSKVPRLQADGLTTSGSVFLRNGFEAEGEVRLIGAQIGGSLSCIRGKFHNSGGNALIADGLTTIGDVFLSGGFEAEGEVRLIGAQIGGTLSCILGKFHNSGGKALSADGFKVTGGFFLRDGAEVDGVLDLTRARFGLISDDPRCWPGKGKLDLDQATYDGFGGDAARVDVRERLRWLGLQHPETGPVDFRPQPYEQLAKVLRSAGHHADARKVLI